MLSTEADSEANRVAAGAAAKRIRRRRHLPGPRAVIGGLLVACAAVGIFAAYAGADSSRHQEYVLARRTLVVGQRVGAADLESATLDLKGTPLAASAYTDQGSLVGSLVVTPVRAGELIQAGDVLDSTTAAPERQVSFPIDPARAVGGNLQVGDRVDVIATFGSGSDATTSLVGSGLRVIGRSDAASGITTSSGATEVVTLALSSSDDPLALVQAINSAQLLLVRSTGADPLPDTGPYSGPYTSSPAAASPPGGSSG